MKLTRKARKRIAVVCFLLPSTFGLVFFSLIPIASSLFLSFTEWDVVGGLPKIIGAANFLQIVKSEEFWRILRNTLYYIVLYVPLITVSSILTASLLNNRYPGIRALRTMFYIPVLTSWVAGALLWKWVLNPQFGILNNLLSLFGISGPGWLYDKYWAMPGIVLASIWKDVGFFGLIFLAGLQGINPTYYEAAAIDGAGWWHKFLRITLPLLSPTLFFVLVISVINSFQLFPQVMVMTEGGPHGATQVLVERIYHYAFRYYKMGYAAALSWLLFLAVFIATMIQMRLQKRWVHYDA